MIPIDMYDFRLFVRGCVEIGKTDEIIKILTEENVIPQGEWITYDVDITPHPLHCKNCGWSNHHIKNEYIKEFKVCPDCGARMRGKEE